MIYVYSAFAYVILSTVILYIGFSKNSWQAVTSESALIFRKPTFYRLGSALYSLLFLAAAMGLFFAPGCPDGTRLTIFLGLFPFACLCFYTAGPSDVRVDLETRICHQTIGWMMHPRKRSLVLTKDSCVSICVDSASYCVRLMIGGGTKRFFVIARPGSLSQAHDIADPIAEQLHLPVKETSLKELSQLF